MANDDLLFQVALTHFASGGVDAASLAAIASDSRVPLAELSQRFESADGLLDAAVTAATRELASELSALAGGEQEPAERLLLMTRRMAAPSDREGLALFVALRELFDGRGRVRRVFRLALEDSYQTFLQVIGEGQFRGQLVPLPPRYILSVLLSSVVFPQLIGYGAAEGMLGGVHEPEAGDDDRGALLTASLQVVFSGVLSAAIDLDPRGIVH